MSEEEEEEDRICSNYGGEGADSSYAGGVDLNDSCCQYHAKAEALVMIVPHDQGKRPQDDPLSTPYRYVQKNIPIDITIRILSIISQKMHGQRMSKTKHARTHVD